MEYVTVGQRQCGEEGEQPELGEAADAVQSPAGIQTLAAGDGRVATAQSGWASGHPLSESQQGAFGIKQPASPRFQGTTPEPPNFASSHPALNQMQLQPLQPGRPTIRGEGAQAP